MEEVAEGTSAGIDNLGKAYYHKENYQQALESYGRSIARDSSNIVAYKGRGWTYIQQGQYQEALEDFSRVLDQVDSSDHYFLQEVYRGRGLSHSGLGQHDKAVEDFDKAFELIGPDDGSLVLEIYISRGWAYYHQKKFLEAVSQFVEALDNLADDSQGECLKSIGQGLIGSCVNLGDASEAEETFEKVLGKVSPEIREKLEESLRDNNKTGGLRDNVLSQLGWAHYLKSDYDAAMKVFDKALSENPVNARSLTGRGWVFYQKGMYAEAIEDASRALQLIDPADKDQLQEAYRVRGFSYVFLNRYHEGLEDMIMAANNTPLNEKNNMKSIAAGILQCCVNGDNLDKAESLFISVMGRFSPEIRLAVESSLGNRKAGSTKEVLLSEMGWACFSRNNYKAAVNSFEKFLSLYPANTSSLLGKGWAYFRLGGYGKFCRIS